MNLEDIAKKYRDDRTLPLERLAAMQGRVSETHWKRERLMAKAHLQEQCGFAGLGYWDAIVIGFQIARWVAWIIRELKQRQSK